MIQTALPVTLGFNTESHMKTIPLRPEPVQWRASGPAEARWNYAFWLQNRECVIGESKSDSESARDDWVNSWNGSIAFAITLQELSPNRASRMTRRERRWHALLTANVGSQ
jgi:hypothetical protein